MGHVRLDGDDSDWAAGFIDALRRGEILYAEFILSQPPEVAAAAAELLQQNIGVLLQDLAVTGPEVERALIELLEEGYDLPEALACAQSVTVG